VSIARWTLRTVLSRLEFLASGRHYALTSTDWMPHAVPWLGFPSWCGVGQTGRGRYGPSFGDTRGGSCPIRWCGPRAWVWSSESLSESASSDRHRGRVIAGESAGWMLGLERIKPVLSSPFRGVSGSTAMTAIPRLGASWRSRSARWSCEETRAYKPTPAKFRAPNAVAGAARII